MRRFTLLFAVLLSLAGVTMKAETLTANFDSSLPDGWNLVGDLTRNSDRARSGSGVWTSSKSNNANYLITEAVEGSITFYARAYNKNTAAYVYIYAYDGSALGSQLYASANMMTNSTPSYSSYTANLGDYKGQVAIALNYAGIDDVTYTQMEAIEGPALAVKDGSTKLTSPYTYDFGLATAGTTKSFTLSNPGTAPTEISVEATNGFGATLSNSAIATGGEETLTITMPDATANGTVTISSSTAGIAPFVINVSCTIREANKVYLDFADGQMPEGWTTASSSTYYSWSVSEGYIGYGGTSSSYAGTFTSPKLTFAKDELIAFETARYSSSTWYNPSITVEYSLDGNTWTPIGSAFTDDVYGTWTSRSVTIPVEGVKYIRFNGWYINLRNIYGGELPNEPKMVVTQPVSLDFGAITETTTKTFTIANTGLATLEGINVTSSNAAFTITGAPTSLEAGASQEVTITMSTANTGALSSDITVSATGMENVTFTVTGVVLPEGMFVVDFNDNALPEGWTNNASNKWSFADGKAYCTSAAELITPKLQFAAGDMIAIKATSYDNYDNNYLEITGSIDGTSWTAFETKKYISRSQIPYGTYATLIVTGIPTTVKYLKFKGYYVRIDEIAGLTYAPVLNVTTGDPATAVSSPASYDFGECATDAYVTYNFTNAGAGTININNVTITGEGAAAYSTNWTESTAAPFELKITRTYDATRAEAQAAVITVTTSEGEFVINVTGTDKAANAPELAVDVTSIDFGKITADASQVVTVTNNGTGTLNVNLAITNDADGLYTINPTVLEHIETGDSKTFTVTLNVSDNNYGVKTADIVVTPTYDESAAMTIACTGKVMDPSLWSEDFSGNSTPKGWDAGSNWTIADGVAKAEYAYGSTTYLTTPTLTVNSATDDLTFDYKATANYVSVKIQMSKDGAAFADYYTISGLNNGVTGTYTITGLEAGVYQFRFANDDYELDNFEGFKLFVPEHKTDIMTSSIPASQSWNMTMKEGKSFEATVTLKENAGKEEAVKAELYMGETVIGSVEATLEAYANTTLTIVATPTTAAVEGAQMYIKVTYAGGELTTAAETRYVAALTYLTLDETSAEAVVAGTYDIVTLKRTFNAGWNTVCLPFVVSDVEAFFGEGAKAYTFSSFAEGVLGFNKVESLSASYPYVVYVPAAITEDIALADITIASTDNDPFYTHINNAYFRGTYAPIAAPNMEGKWGVTDEGRIAQGSAAASIDGFRAYFELPATTSAPMLSIDGGPATPIDALRLNGMENGVYYDLNGRRVAQPSKGLYIINGKKVVIK